MPQSIPSPETEEWRPVVGYEGWYEVSSLGRVRRARPGHGTRIGRILGTHPNRSGYPRVTLSRESRDRKVFVHVLVARAFVGPCPTGHEVNHKDLNRCNPTASNLEYVTRSGNVVHAIQNGSRDHDPRGTDKPNAKLTEVDVRAIRSSSKSLRVLGRQYGVSSVTILKIKRREKWGHVE